MIDTGGNKSGAPDAKRQQIIESFGQFNQLVVRERQGFISEIVTATEKKQVAFRAIKDEIVAELRDLNDRCEALNRKIGANIADENNDKGVLLHKESEYTSCLTLKYERLNELLDKDEGIWERKLEEAKVSVDLTDKMDELFAQFKAKFASLLMPELDPRCGIHMWTLRKMPMFGQQVPQDVITFDWPDYDKFEELPSDTRLEAISLKTDGNDLTSVQAHLSNGESSEVFERARVNHRNA